MVCALRDFRAIGKLDNPPVAHLSPSLACVGRDGRFDLGRGEGLPRAYRPPVLRDANKHYTTIGPLFQERFGRLRSRNASPQGHDYELVSSLRFCLPLRSPMQRIGAVLPYSNLSQTWLMTLALRYIVRQDRSGRTHSKCLRSPITSRLLSLTPNSTNFLRALGTTMWIAYLERYFVAA
jgi:hypothetical protein